MPDFHNFYAKISRTRKLTGDVMKTELNRCLNTFDLVLIGIGSMVGSGMYVLAGEIAHEITGPSLFLAFLVAGFASALSAWCYAEFGSRVPKAGSAYIYTYLTIGELAAFVIGWNLVLEHVIGSAAVVRGLIGYINAVSNDAVEKITPSFLVEHNLDPYTSVIIIGIAIVVCLGIKESVWVNNTLTAINISVALFVIVCGFYLADRENWSDFFPYGASSIFEGAAQAYFAFVGYDTITIASEEALTPGFSVPVALTIVVFFVGTLYCSISAALTLMIPYQKIDNDAAFASAFDYNDWEWAKYVVSVGAIAAMTCALLGTMLTMPRCIYAMASDGIIFRFMSKVSQKTQVPVVATVLGSIGVCIFAFFLSLRELAEFMSIGTLLAYMLIAVAVIVMRYHPTDLITGEPFSKSEHDPLVVATSWSRNQTIALFTFLSLSVFTTLTLLGVKNAENNSVLVASLVLAGIGSVLMVASLTYLALISKENHVETTCRVPFVPFLPGLSVFVNMYLMSQLNAYTWLRFGLWMLVGFFVYFFYGISHSNLSPENDQFESEELKGSSLDTGGEANADNAKVE